MDLPYELVVIIIWNAFLGIKQVGQYAAGSSNYNMLTVCRQWYDILTDINTMIMPTITSITERICIAIRINRAIISPRTIALYFSDFRTDTNLSAVQICYYMDIFCSSYQKEIWQYMRMPSVEYLDYLSFDLSILLQRCNRSPDAFFYLYHLTKRKINFWYVLYDLTNWVKSGKYFVKQINWFIKSFERQPTRFYFRDIGSNQLCSIFANLISSRYSFRRIRLLFAKLADRLAYYDCQPILRTIIKILCREKYLLLSHTYQDRRRNIEEEIAYYQDCKRNIEEEIAFYRSLFSLRSAKN